MEYRYVETKDNGAQRLWSLDILKIRDGEAHVYWWKLDIVEYKDNGV